MVVTSCKPPVSLSNFDERIIMKVTGFSEQKNDFKLFKKRKVLSPVARLKKKTDRPESELITEKSWGAIITRSLSYPFLSF